MTGDRSKKKQNCKGVNAVVENSNISVSVTDSESCSNRCGKSINRIKNELNTVIELMGPTTPHFNISSSNNADNEDSTLSFTAVDRATVDDESVLTECDCSTLPTDEQTTQEGKDFSMMVDKHSTMVDIQENEEMQYICPPPKLPVNFVFNSECMCPQIANYIQNGHSKEQTLNEKPSKQRSLIKNIFKSFKEKRNNSSPGKCEYYTMNIKQSQTNMGNPRRLVFELVDDIPKPSDFQCRCQFSDKNVEEKADTHGKESYGKENKNFQNELVSMNQNPHRDKIFSVDEGIDPRMIKTNKKVHRKTTLTDSSGTTRVDVYYFDHGNSSYLRTTDRPPLAITEGIAEKTEAHTTKFWAELFGTFHIGFAFFTSFILQTIRFLLYSVIRPLTVGMMQLVSDYFFKPLLATLFNACIQPVLIFFYNIASSLRDCCDPLAEGLGYFLREIAFVIRSFRIVEVRNGKCSEVTSRCGREK